MTKITQAGIEKLGFYLVLKNEEQDSDYTFNKKNPLLGDDWVYCLVWHPETDFICLTTHPPLQGYELGILPLIIKQIFRLENVDMEKLELLLNIFEIK